MPSERALALAREFVDPNAWGMHERYQSRLERAAAKIDEAVKELRECADSASEDWPNDMNIRREIAAWTPKEAKP